MYSAYIKDFKTVMFLQYEYNFPLHEESHDIRQKEKSHKIQLINDLDFVQITGIR